MKVMIYTGAPLTEEAISALAGEVSVETVVCRSEEELADAIRASALETGETAPVYVRFSGRQGLHLLDLNKVRYIRSHNHRLIASLTDGSELISKVIRVSAQEILGPLLRQGKLIKCFRSHYVNIAHIKCISLEGVQLLDGEMLPISRKYYSEISNFGLDGKQAGKCVLRQESTPL